MPNRDVEEWFWLPGEEMHRLAEEMSRQRPRIASGRAWEPRVDLIEEEHRFLLKAEIAGVRSEHIHLLYIPERHSVLLKGTRQEDDFSDGNRAGVHQLEIFYGEFAREIRLPDVAIDADGIRATYRNGILLVMVPKRERAATCRTILIRKT
jgi:HSP20 family protein